MEKSGLPVECIEEIPRASQESKIISSEEICTDKTLKPKTESKVETKYFHCEICALHEIYDYFGNDPPFVKHYKLLENAYVIENPFGPPKQNDFIILGTHCIKCGKSICKDSNCSLYYDGTYCIYCAKDCINVFPQNVQEKLNKIIT